MRLDLSAFRYLSNDDFRVLTAIEMGMRNHEIVPVTLIESISKIKRVNTNKTIANLLKYKLIEHSNIKYDGYSLNYIGYDYLAIHSLTKRGVLKRIGPKLGVGKESDVYICWVNPLAGQEAELPEEDLKKLQNEMILDFLENNKDQSDDDDNDNDNEINANKNFNLIKEENKHNEIIPMNLENEDNMRFDEEIIINDIKCKIAVIKLARLGRTSFRAIKNKRDYVKNKSHYNWLYLSRVSATNEFKYLTGLYNKGFSVPIPYDHNRHAILMDYIPSFPLSRIEDLGDKEKAFNELVSTLVKLATKGLIHGDFNEFNILVHMKTQKLYFIDFPQMISLEHEDAKKYFDRDLLGVNKFFYKKFGMKFDNNIVDFNDIQREDYMDISLKAYGHMKILNKIRNEEIEDKNEKKIKEFLAINNQNDNEDLEFEEINKIPKEENNLNENKKEFENENYEEDEDLEKIKEAKKMKKKKQMKKEKEIENENENENEKDTFIKQKNLNILSEEDDIDLEGMELRDVLNKKENNNENKDVDKNENFKIEMKLSKDDIREMVKKALVKQINNTGTKGKSNRFKAKKNDKINKVDL
jgi:RIO kinase 2